MERLYISSPMSPIIEEEDLSNLGGDETSSQQGNFMVGGRHGFGDSDKSILKKAKMIDKEYKK